MEFKWIKNHKVYLLDNIISTKLYYIEQLGPKVATVFQIEFPKEISFTSSRFSSTIRITTYRCTKEEWNRNTAPQNQARYAENAEVFNLIFKAKI
jgi:hypothetical protein